VPVDDEQNMLTPDVPEAYSLASRCSRARLLSVIHRTSEVVMSDRRAPSESEMPEASCCRVPRAGCKERKLIYIITVVD